MMRKIILITAIIFVTESIPQPLDSLYSLSVDVGLGYSRYLTTLEFEDLNKHGFSGTLRVMWHPEHLLCIGIETGYQYLYSIKSTANSELFGSSELKASMISVPVLFVSSMRIFPQTFPYLELKGGGGVFFLFNNGELYGSSIYSEFYSFGYHFSASYLQPVSEDISIGAEAKYYYISKIQDADLSVQFMISYKFLKW